jgi:L-gulonolactone oxidase
MDDHTNNRKWISWNKNLKHDYQQLFTPTQEKNIAEIVKSAEKVKVFGNKQSSADIAANSDVLIDMRKYNKIVNINQEKKQITIQSGATLKTLIETAEANNWCIPCLPDIDTVTIGGAIATGTHGTNGEILANYMIGCRLILANGEIQTVEAETDLMDAVRLAIGTLGILTEITFQCEPIYYLHLKEGQESDDVWLANIEDNLKEYDFLRILWLPHTGYGYTIKGKKVPADFNFEPIDGPSYLRHRRSVSKFLYKYTHIFPWLTAFANKILYFLFFRSEKEHHGSLYQATVTKSRGSTLELAEWTIGISKFPEVFKELKTEINRWSNKAFVHIPMDIRFLNKDQTWLSYAYDDDVVTMGCVSRNALNADNYEAFNTIEKIFIKHGGRPHWGKRFKTKDEELSKLYPKWNDFKKLRAELDPTGKFLNPYLKTVFNVE